MIRVAKPTEHFLLQNIETAAGRAFAEIGMSEVADDEPPSLEVLLRYQSDGRAWVAVDDFDRPVAYLIADVVDGNAHIEQVSVHPDFAHKTNRQGSDRSDSCVGPTTWAAGVDTRDLRRRPVERAVLRTVRVPAIAPVRAHRGFARTT